MDEPEERRMAIGLIVGIFAQINWITEVMGTARNIPTIPHTYPQRLSIIKMTSGDRFSLTPWSFGSITFPRIICITRKAKNMTKTLLHIGKNCTAATNVAPTVTTMLPMVGMKFNRKAKTPNTSGKSIPLIIAVK